MWHLALSSVVLVASPPTHGAISLAPVHTLKLFPTRIPVLKDSPNSKEKSIDQKYFTSLHVSYKLRKREMLTQPELGLGRLKSIQNTLLSALFCYWTRYTERITNQKGRKWMLNGYFNLSLFFPCLIKFSGKPFCRLKFIFTGNTLVEAAFQSEEGGLNCPPSNCFVKPCLPCISL